MKSRLGTLAVVACVGIGMSIWYVGAASPALASPEVTAATATVAISVMGEEGPAYVGSKKCKMCHKDQFKSWEEGKKSKALEVLKPGAAAEVKTKHNLDPAKDYTTDEGCLKCHTTGYGHEGGYAIPDPADEKAVKKAAKLAGAGCESCHGPGGDYIAQHKEIKKSKRTYATEEMYKAGMWKIEADKCTTCHNDKSPTFEGFDFAVQKEKGGHEHFPLTQRQE